jgi:hypothetical protein
MRRYTPVILAALFLAVQFILSLAATDRFMKHVRQDAELMERQMAERGVPPEQRQHVISAASSMGLNVSSYVREVTGLSIVTNAGLLVLLLYWYRKKEVASPGEA